MGGEIAQVIASAGVPVVLKDIDQKFVDRPREGRRGHRRSRSVAGQEGEDHPGQADQQLGEILGRITGTTSYDGFGDVDFVIEAVPERMEIKQSRLRRARRVHARPRDPRVQHLGLSITEMGDATLRPDKVVGFHFFWPASMMRLIEVIEGEATSEETLQTATNFAQAIRKTAVRCGEVPGFVVNRILMSRAAEIWRVTEEEGHDAQEVDKMIQESKARPDGAVLPGRHDRPRHDVCHVAQHMVDSYGDRFYIHPG